MVYTDSTVDINGNTQDGKDQEGFLCGGLFGKNSFNQHAGCI